MPTIHLQSYSKASHTWTSAPVVLEQESSFDVLFIQFHLS